MNYSIHKFEKFRQKISVAKWTYNDYAMDFLSITLKCAYQTTTTSKFIMAN